MNRKYLASLAAVACFILLLGVLLRRQLPSTELRTAPVASEASALQQLTMDGQLRRMSSFVNERASAVANLVEFLPNVNAAAVRWNGDTVISTLSGKPVYATFAPRRDTLRQRMHAPADSATRTWVLVIGRRDDGSMLSLPAFTAGTGTVRCGAAQPQDEPRRCSDRMATAVD